MTRPTRLPRVAPKSVGEPVLANAADVASLLVVEWRPHHSTAGIEVAASESWWLEAHVDGYFEFGAESTVIGNGKSSSPKRDAVLALARHIVEQARTLVEGFVAPLVTPPAVIKPVAATVFEWICEEYGWTIRSSNHSRLLLSVNFNDGDRCRWFIYADADNQPLVGRGEAPTIDAAKAAAEAAWLAMQEKKS